MCTRLRPLPSLGETLGQMAKISYVTSATLTPCSIVNVQRIEHVINGRAYQIEAMLVDPDRWRAYLVSVPGGSTALMPFYGATPELGGATAHCLADSGPPGAHNSGIVRTSNAVAPHVRATG